MDDLQPDSVRAVWHRSEQSGDLAQVREESLDVKAELTVEAWVRGVSFRPEALQSIVSKWAPSDSYGTFAAYDAGHTDGLRSEGYFGAVFDGRYVYFSPEHYVDHEAHGIALRYDTYGDLHAADSYEAYDAGHTDGLNTKGYYGAVFDGRYVYYVPRQNADEYHSRVLRFDTHREFCDEDGWEAYDFGEEHSSQGAAFDGRYIYFSPGYTGDPRTETGNSSSVIRFDTAVDFKDPGSWKSFDAGEISELNVSCFDGAGFDGRYVHLAPLLHSAPLRYDTRGDFGDRSSWDSFDARKVNMGMCVGTVFDGRYMYYVAYANSVIARFDTRGEFEDESCWESRDVCPTDGLNTSGFDGGFFDGTHVYFVPFVGPPMGECDDGTVGYTFHCNFLRYDPTRPFHDAGSWQAADAESVDGLRTIGYNGGAFDGRFFYLAPWRDGTGDGGMHGRVLRYDTVGNNATFDLRYCDLGHNGGLCAAVPGPTFLVNTVQGARSVAAHQSLTPGKHHLVGVYDGRSIKLYLDGALAVQRSCSGEIQMSDAEVVVSGEKEKTGRFDGVTEEVRIWNVAQEGEWVRKEYERKMRPR